MLQSGQTTGSVRNVRYILKPNIGLIEYRIIPYQILDIKLHTPQAPQGNRSSTKPRFLWGYWFEGLGKGLIGFPSPTLIISNSLLDFGPGPPKSE